MSRSSKKEDFEALRQETEKVNSIISQMEGEKATLRQEIEKVETKNRFLEAEIQRENRPLGFDFSSSVLSRHQLSQLKSTGCGS